MVELLVVILIVGVLAAVAIPSFLGQKGKADDAAAKSQARTAQIAAETIATENDGSYSTVNVSQLQATEPSLQDTATATLSVGTVSTHTYQVISTSDATGESYTITHNSDGSVTRTCSTGSGFGDPGGCLNNTW